MSNEIAAVPQEPNQPKPVSLIAKLAGKFHVDASKMMSTLKSTAFKGEVSNEQMMALLVVADQYGLNPWTKEIYAFPDKNNGVVPVVGVDGWSRIINSHPQFDGMEFVDGPEDKNGLPAWIECVIYRKDRTHPTRVREYMTEVRRDVAPWRSHPRRMLRHKATIQCARLAMGYVGIYDQDEAERIVEGEARVVPQASEAISSINARIAPKADVTDIEPGTAAFDIATHPAEVVNTTEMRIPQQDDGAPKVTFAKVMESLQKAAKKRDVDLLDAAAGLIEEITDEVQHGELTVTYHQLRSQITA